MISKKVHDELMAVRRVLNYLPVSPSTEYGWTPHERAIFWDALDRFPRGPWTAIAEFIGTKSTRQAMTHGQKLRQKLKRWDARLHRNPTARSLMDDVIVTPTSSVSVTTEVSATVSAPSCHYAVTSSSFGMNILPSPRPMQYEDEDAVRVALDGRFRSLRQQNEELTAKSCSDSIAVQAETPRQGSSTTSGSTGHTSPTLQMVFEPGAVTTQPTAAPNDVGETKLDEESFVPHPICEPPISARNLLDELADVLWNDHASKSM